MRVDYTNSGPYPVTVLQLQQNLRLPAGMDVSLLDRLILSAVDYVEKVGNICLVDKDVKITYVGYYPLYSLKWAANPDEDITVKVNGDTITDYKVSYNNPAYLKLGTRLEDGDFLEISYKAKASVNYNAIELVIAYASALYNNPEGIEELDMRRINNRLTTISH